MSENDEVMSTAGSAAGVGKMVEPVGVTVEVGGNALFVTPAQARVIRMALDEWRYTVACGHAENADALAVIGQIDERFGR